MITGMIKRATYPLVIALFLPCSGDASESVHTSPSHNLTQAGELRLVIRWGGDDFASKQDLELRSKLETLIEEKEVGHVFRSGTGMGWMDIWVKVENKGQARKALEGIMREVAPQKEYSVVFPSPPVSSSKP
jgi:hypothetical protein